MKPVESHQIIYSCESEMDILDRLSNANYIFDILIIKRIPDRSSGVILVWLGSVQ